MFAINQRRRLGHRLVQSTELWATFEEAVYKVEGNYTFAENGETRRRHPALQQRSPDPGVRFYWNRGVASRTRSPLRWVTPFTVLEKWLDLDLSRGAYEGAYQDRRDPDLRPEPGLEMEQLDAAIGQYVVGFIVPWWPSYTAFTQVHWCVKL